MAVVVVKALDCEADWETLGRGRVILNGPEIRVVSIEWHFSSVPAEVFDTADNNGAAAPEPEGASDTGCLEIDEVETIVFSDELLLSVAVKREELSIAWNSHQMGASVCLCFEHKAECEAVWTAICSTQGRPSEADISDSSLRAYFCYSETDGEELDLFLRAVKKLFLTRLFLDSDGHCSNAVGCKSKKLLKEEVIIQSTGDSDAPFYRSLEQIERIVISACLIKMKVFHCRKGVEYFFTENTHPMLPFGIIELQNVELMDELLEPRHMIHSGVSDDGEDSPDNAPNDCTVFDQLIICIRRFYNNFTDDVHSKDKMKSSGVEQDNMCLFVWSIPPSLQFFGGLATHTTNRLTAAQHVHTLRNDVLQMPASVISEDLLMRSAAGRPLTAALLASLEAEGTIPPVLSATAMAFLDVYTQRLVTLALGDIVSSGSFLRATLRLLLYPSGRSAFADGLPPAIFSAILHTLSPLCSIPRSGEGAPSSSSSSRPLSAAERGDELVDSPFSPAESGLRPQWHSCFSNRSRSLGIEFSSVIARARCLVGESPGGAAQTSEILKNPDENIVSILRFLTCVLRSCVQLLSNEVDQVENVICKMFDTGLLDALNFVAENYVNFFREKNSAENCADSNNSDCTLHYSGVVHVALTTFFSTVFTTLNIAADEEIMNRYFRVPLTTNHDMYHGLFNLFFFDSVYLCKSGRSVLFDLFGLHDDEGFKCRRDADSTIVEERDAFQKLCVSELADYLQANVHIFTDKSEIIGSCGRLDRGALSDGPTLNIEALFMLLEYLLFLGSRETKDIVLHKIIFAISGRSSEGTLTSKSSVLILCRVAFQTSNISRELCSATKLLTAVLNIAVPWYSAKRAVITHREEEEAQAARELSEYWSPYILYYIFLDRHAEIPVRKCSPLLSQSSLSGVDTIGRHSDTMCLLASTRVDSELCCGSTIFRPQGSLFSLLLSAYARLGGPRRCSMFHSQFNCLLKLLSADIIYADYYKNLGVAPGHPNLFAGSISTNKGTKTTPNTTYSFLGLARSTVIAQGYSQIPSDLHAAWKNTQLSEMEEQVLAVIEVRDGQSTSLRTAGIRAAFNQRTHRSSVSISAKHLSCLEGLRRMSLEQLKATRGSKLFFEVDEVDEQGGSFEPSEIARERSPSLKGGIEFLSAETRKRGSFPIGENSAPPPYLTQGVASPTEALFFAKGAGSIK